MAERDAVVIGAGHNGLVAANYLAKAGLRVLVVERSDRVGGACVTDEIAPGFKVSAAAYVSGLFRPQIIEDLEGDREVLEERCRRVPGVRGDVGRGLRSRRADAARPAGPDRRTGLAPAWPGSGGPPAASALLQ